MEKTSEEIREEFEKWNAFADKVNERQEILELYYGMSPSMQKAVKDVMLVTQAKDYVPQGDK